MATIRSSRDSLLRQLVDMLTQVDPGVPVAVGVTRLGDEVELATRPLDEPDVVRALTGFHAPDSWDAFGVVAPARATALDAASPPRPVVVAVLAARDGSTVGSLAEPSGTRSPDTGGEGRVLDACRRVLGLATPAPARRPQLWSVLHWLDAVLASVLSADLGAVPSWSQLAWLDVGRAYARRPWSDLRGDCAAGRIRIPHVDAACAAWMDDGMFSREALTAYPPMLEMLTDLEALLPPDTFARILDTLTCRLDGDGDVDVDVESDQAPR